jgi:O-antigen/teichoic acid export membrane protein
MTVDVRRRPLSGHFFYATLSASSTGLLLILSIVAARMLGTAEWGRFSFALALATIFETLMDFGLHQVAIRSIARDPSDASSLFQNALGLKLALAIGMMASLLVAATLLQTDPTIRLVSGLLGLSMILRSYLLAVRSLLQGLELFAADSIVIVIDRALLLLASVATLVLGHGIRGLAVAFVASRVLSFGLAARLARRRLGTFRLRFDRQIWVDLQLQALPIGSFLAVWNVYSYIDTVLLSMLRGPAETGVYSAAYKIYEGLAYVPAVLASVLTPRLASYHTTDAASYRRLARQGLGGGLLLATLIAVPLFILARPLVLWLFGQTYATAADALRILVVGLPGMFSIWLLVTLAMSSNRERLLLKTGLIGCVTNVGLNVWLIPPYGVRGAAAATVLGDLVCASVLYLGLRSRTATETRAANDQSRTA